MHAKIEFKNLAIQLRREGHTYAEILAEVKVAKSTLSNWLQQVNLSKIQKQQITDKKLVASRKGGEVRKQQRLEATRQIHQKAILEVGKITDRELWLLGAMLYWAEGSKEKAWRPGSGVRFTNSDPEMIRFFLFWLLQVCKIRPDDIGFDLYIHENYQTDISRRLKYWSEVTNFPLNQFTHVYFKKNKLSTRRRNVGTNYFGVLRINVKRSSTLNRQIAGWVKGVVKYAMN